MPIVTFGRAARKGAHVIITAYGESGCGKTYSLIMLGRGLVGPKGKLGMLDTETGRGLIYANIGSGYEYAELTPPFTPERYIEAIDAAEEAGIEALIIDSGSLEWEGLGGVLEIADNNNLKGLVKWAGPKSRHKRYVQRLLNSRMHLLIALRAKEKMVQLTDKMPIPRGMKIGDIISAGYVPIQDKRFIFETTVQLFLPTSNDRRRLGIPIVEKCPEDLWGAFSDGEQISEDTGRRIAEWIGDGAPVDHGFERMKRDAEEVAGRGTEALREHWRILDKPARQRLSSQTDNLASIASAADHEQELRRRESDLAAEQSAPNLDAPFGDRGIKFAGATGSPPAPETPAPSDGPPAAEQPHSAPRGGAKAPPAGNPQPSDDERMTVAGNDRTSEPQTKPAGEPRDLLGGQPSEDVFVPFDPARPDFFARQIIAVIAEKPGDGARIDRIRTVNGGNLTRLRNALPSGHDDVQRALAAPR